MRKLTLTLLTIAAAFSSAAFAKDISFDYKNAELAAVIKDYSKASGQKFIIDPSIQGKITIINPGKISVEEAYNQLSSALATNGVGISKQNDILLIQQARAIQRNLIEVGTELPPIHPTKMYTWVINMKNANADEVNKQLRILTSKDGELVPVTRTNQIMVTDWTPNLHRISKILAEVDKPVAKK